MGVDQASGASVELDSDDILAALMFYAVRKARIPLPTGNVRLDFHLGPSSTPGYPASLSGATVTFIESPVEQHAPTASS